MENTNYINNISEYYFKLLKLFSWCNVIQCKDFEVWKQVNLNQQSFFFSNMALDQ